MVKIELNNETSIQEKIANAIKGIWEASTGNWVSCIEKPLTVIFKQCDLPKNYFSHVTNILTSHGVLFTEGQRAGMIYKMDHYIDPEKLVPLVIQAQKEYGIEYRKTLPKKPRKKETIQEDSPLKIISKSSIPLGTIVYTMLDGVPIKGIISGSTLSKEDMKISYQIRYKEDEGEERDSHYIGGSKIFLSIDTLLEYIKKILN